MAHVLWDILHVEYNGDGLLAIWVHLGEPSCKVRSRSCQKFKILKCLILKNKDMFLMQNVPRNPMVPLFLCTWSLTPPPPKKKSRLIVWRHHQASCRKKFSFWGQKINVSFWNFVLWWALARCLTIIRFFENFQNFGFYGHFYSFKNKKDVFEFLGINITKYQKSEIAIL